jgi:hypothetical protein
MEIDRVKLLTALEKVAPGLATSENIAQSASFVFTDGKVYAYNDEIAVGHLIDVGIEGAVSSKELLALLKKLKSETVEMEVKKNELLINNKKVKSGITMESEILLPIEELIHGWGEDRFGLPDKFMKGVKICLTSCASDTESIILSNIHMKGKYLESCDNYQMTRFDMGDDSQEDILIPAAACKYLIHYKVDQYFQTDGWIHFGDGEDLIFSCRIIEDEYPDLESILKVNGNMITLPEQLNEIIDRSNIFNSRIQINILKNWCKVRAESDTGWIEEKVRIKEKRDIDFNINSQMLQTILKISNKLTVGKQSLKFEMNDFIHIIALVETT